MLDILMTLEFECDAYFKIEKTLTLKISSGKPPLPTPQCTALQQFESHSLTKQ